MTDEGMICARCNTATGNNNQGHYWALCKALMKKGVPYTDAIREHHFCCPGDCELEADREQSGAGVETPSLVIVAGRGVSKPVAVQA